MIDDREHEVWQHYTKELQGKKQPAWPDDSDMQTTPDYGKGMHEQNLLRRIRRDPNWFTDHDRLDLHGFDRDKAYMQLMDFIHARQGKTRRSVLIITGKGQRILSTALPEWLQTPPLSQMVSHFGPAARCHGGTGAFYVLIKRSI
ncbi:MAG: Smr/MutS family protein [Pseudomonadota bacterium]